MSGSHESTFAGFSPAFAPVVEQIEGAVLSAARYLDGEMRSGNPPQVWVKPDHSLVMSIDLECQRLVLDRLGTQFPIVAEEDESSHGLIDSEADYFLVDPLDGTTSCRRFLGQFGGHVGYGPLVGFVKNGLLSAASFYSAPHCRLFTAVAGEGAWVSDIDFAVASKPVTRRRITARPCDRLDQAGVLFYIGTRGESAVMQQLRNANALENMYRFGGFAGDCCRLAQGLEQMSVQFSVKPWDYSGVLISREAGLEVWMDPLARKIPFESWKIEMNNPSIIVLPSIRDELFSVLGR